jgi:hypothetical protein
VFDDSTKYTILGSPGLYSFHMLFPTVYSKCVSAGMINEDGMRNVLGLLLVETPEHESPDFRKPLDLEFWSKEHGPLLAVTMNRNTIQQLHKNLNKKINLAQEV